MATVSVNTCDSLLSKITELKEQISRNERQQHHLRGEKDDLEKELRETRLHIKALLKDFDDDLLRVLKENDR